MTYEQFKNAIEAAGFTTDYNRISATNPDAVNILDMLEALGFKSSEEIVRGKTWINVARSEDDFYLTYRKTEEIGHFSGVTIESK